MGIFKKNNMNVNATVDINRVVEQLIFNANQFRWIEFLRQRTITEIKNATEALYKKIDKGDVEYCLYSNFDNYAVEIRLAELAEFIPKDLMDGFRRASKAYTAAREKQRKEKEQ